MISELVVCREMRDTFYYAENFAQENAKCLLHGL